jgi:hypothetical protein
MLFMAFSFLLILGNGRYDAGERWGTHNNTKEAERQVSAAAGSGRLHTLDTY